MKKIFLFTICILTLTNSCTTETETIVGLNSLIKIEPEVKNINCMNGVLK